MTGGAKAFRIASVAAGFTILVLIGSALFSRAQHDRAERELPVYWNAPQFALVDQAGDTLHTEDLAGTAWIASFIFTHCESVCPLITARMARVRDSLAAAGLLGTRVRLVSFTVDPARDTPEVLRAYARRFGGSPPSEWAFLTGSRPDAVRRMIQEGFRLTAMLPTGGATPTDSTTAASTAAVSATAASTAAASHEHGNYQVMHSPRLLLVDGAGRIRGLYRARDADAVARVLEDARLLLEGGPSLRAHLDDASTAE